ncbi:hypothetical protein [Streptomyces caelestis]
MEPSDTADNDKMGKPGTFLGGTEEDWQEVADVLSAVSTVSGGLAAAPC